MAGHSHWSRIKRQKAANDKKRGKLFSKLAKYIMVAARNGGPDSATNLQLKYAIDKAKSASMPADNIERAIKRGSGELEKETFEQVLYEGYGPGGTAVLAEALTDNRNRTAAEVRKLFEKYGGNLGEAGCVAWNFEPHGVVLVPPAVIDEDSLTEAAIAAGAEDVRPDGGGFQVLSGISELDGVVTEFKRRGVKIESAGIEQVPKNTVAVEGDAAKKTLSLTDELQDHDDIQSVYTNCDFPDELLRSESA